MGFWAGLGKVALGTVVAGPIGTVVTANYLLVNKNNSADKERLEKAEAKVAKMTREAEAMGESMKKAKAAAEEMKKFHEYIVGAFALGICVANCDGSIDESEITEINEFIAGIMASDMPGDIKDAINKLRNNPPSIYEATLRLELEAACNAAYDIDTHPSISLQDAAALLSEVRKEFDQKRIDELMRATRRSVLESISGPFGLGGVLHRLDKDGGPVTTVHNARQGIYANADDRDRFEAPFDRRDYEKDFPKMRKSILQTEGGIIDSYTGNILPNDGRMHLDHVKSAREIHSDELLRLATSRENRNEIATNHDNIAPTFCSLNQSKNDRDLMEWKNAKGKDGAPNGKRYAVDDRRADVVYGKAQNHFKAEKIVAVTTHFGQEVGRDAMITGAGMGVQQALGLLLAELGDALFDEVKDIFINGFNGGAIDKGFIDVVREKFTRVGERVLDRWKDAVEAFKAGALAGFLSTIVTTLINMFLTTAKRIVRMIREGGMSLLRAAKLLLNPPEGMTLQQAAHEASKLILAGVVIIGGIALEEIVSKWTDSIPLGGAISAVVIGLVTGLGTVLGAYMIDKIDFFGVIADARQGHVISSLTQRFDDAHRTIDDCLAAFEPVKRDRVRS